MRSRALLSSIFGITLFTVPLLAGGLDKFKDWNQSPQGYFMTSAERTQWAAIKTDEDAEKFVAAFLASRKPGFADEVAMRAKQADKYLTVAKVPGSKSLRGKVIILLGPPSEPMDVSVTSREDSKRDNPFVTSAMTNTGGFDTGGGGRGSGGSGGGGTTLSTSQGLKNYHFSYEGASAKSFDRDSIDINVEVDAATGKDRIASRSEAADVDKIFEIAAQSWLKR